jgi:hypothetical protein
MATEDNQIAQTSTETKKTVKNITGYIHFNDGDNLDTVFTNLKQFHESHKLKYFHHRKGFIFFSVKSDCLDEFSKVQKFKISHYNSKSTYSCSKEVADKLLAVMDSFVRMSWVEEDGHVLFLSRTLGRVHNDLIRRIFKTSGERFDNSNYHFEPFVKTTETTATTEAETTEEVVKPKRRTFTQKTTDSSFTKTPRNKDKYNKKKVEVEQAPKELKTRGSKQKTVSA